MFFDACTLLRAYACTYLLLSPTDSALLKDISWRPKHARMAPAIQASQENHEDLAGRRAINATDKAARAERRREKVQGALSRWMLITYEFVAHAYSDARCVLHVPVCLYSFHWNRS